MVVVEGTNNNNNVEKVSKVTQAVAQVAAEAAAAHGKLGIKELKEQLTAAGISFAGATEKDDLVRLLTKASVQAAASKMNFVATHHWQKVPDGASLPPGLEVRFDMTTSCNYARLPHKKHGT